MLVGEGWRREEIRWFVPGGSGIQSDEFCCVEEAPFEARAIGEIFRREKPDLVFLGTSQGNHEYPWIDSAEKVGIRTISYVDHWTNIRNRFETAHGLCLPDEIWVVNAAAREIALRDGIPDSRIRVVRNPYYELVETYVPEITRVEFLKMLDLRHEVILFISDTVREAFPEVGFDEVSTTEAVLHTLVGLQRDALLPDYDFLIKLHPKCAEGKYQALIENYQSPHLRIHEVRDSNANLYTYHADYVIGMFSNMVVEALLMGRRVLRVEIDRRMDLFHFTEVDCPVVTERGSLRCALINFLKLPVPGRIGSEHLDLGPSRWSQP